MSKQEAEEYEKKMTKKDTKILEMAKDIINLELRLSKNSIGKGDCPFEASPLKTRLDINCNATNCCDCDGMWAKKKRKEITEEVIARYNLLESEE